jgi:hypothetical protein
MRTKQTCTVISMRYSIVLLALLVFSPELAYAQVGQIVISPKLEDICDENEPVSERRTIVYIDFSSIKADDLDWGLTVLNKLNLTPRENLIVLGVNPKNMAVNEVFNLCFPKFTQEEIASVTGDRGIVDWLVSTDPKSQQNKNIELFDNRLKTALDNIRNMALKADLKSDDKKNILAAISLDKDRFGGIDEYWRIIIYSDGIISDPVVKFQDINNAQDINRLAEAYPTNFKGSEIAMFGVTPTSGGTGTEKRESIFRGYFLLGAGWLRSFSYGLPNQDDQIVSEMKRYEGKYSGGGVNGPAAMSFGLAEEGELADAWLEFGTPRGPLFIPIEGNGGCADGKCRVKGRVLEDVPQLSDQPFFRKGDQILVEGESPNLSGSLESGTPESFDGKDTSVRYDLKLADTAGNK